MSESEAIIRLNIFTLRAAQALSKVVSSTLANLEPTPITKDAFVDIQPFLKVADDGEFFLTLASATGSDDNEPNAKFNFNLDLVKTAVQYYICFLTGAEDVIAYRTVGYQGGKNYDDDTKAVINDLEAILRWWNGNATDEDLKLVGHRLNPFEAHSLSDLINDLKDYEKNGSDGIYKSSDFLSKIIEIQSEISIQQNRFDDLILTYNFTNVGDDSNSIEEILGEVFANFEIG